MRSWTDVPPANRFKVHESITIRIRCNTSVMKNHVLGEAFDPGLWDGALKVAEGPIINARWCPTGRSREHRGGLMGLGGTKASKVPASPLKKGEPLSFLVRSPGGCWGRSLVMIVRARARSCGGGTPRLRRDNVRPLLTSSGAIIDERGGMSLGYGKGG